MSSGHGKGASQGESLLGYFILQAVLLLFALGATAWVFGWYGVSLLVGPGMSRMPRPARTTVVAPEVEEETLFREEAQDKERMNGVEVAQTMQEEAEVQARAWSEQQESESFAHQFSLEHVHD
jgi:hypothetical protein